MGDFSHLNETGEAAMVDVTDKAATSRTAVVSGAVTVSPMCASMLTTDSIREICATARIAGISAAKETARLIPMCHPLPLTKVEVAILWHDGAFDLVVTTKTNANTGVEMEALCAASIAGATIYDMIKAVDPAAVVGPFILKEKHGGKSGIWTRVPVN